MAMENLKQNIKMEKELIKELIIFNSQLVNLDKLYPYEKRENERRILIKAINSSLEKLRIINNAIPGILDAISAFKKLGEKEEEIKNLTEISYNPKSEEKVFATVEKGDKERFLKELSMGKDTLKRLKKSFGKEKKTEFMEFKKANLYAKISNKIFFNLSTGLFNKDKLKRLNSDLRKANMPFLVTTYFSMTLFSILLAFFLGVAVFIFLLFFSVSSDFPFIISASPSFTDILRNLLIAVALPFITFTFFYFYPYLEGKNVESRIDEELPFIAIHMSAIAGSGIEPTQIFKIIAVGEEYPYTKKELKKIINQVNVYGYDLITALKNTARETSSRKLSELLNGIATAISSGGSLGEFLDKRAETLLFGYRLERERYTKSAETFMDIYISIVIAAPMIMTLLLVLIAVSGISVGLSLQSLNIIIVLGISLINILFMVFLHLSQPSY